MSKHRILSEKSKYYLPKETFLMVVHYCKQYPLWDDELSALTDTSKAIAYDTDRVQVSPDSDPTSELAIRRAGISQKKDMVDNTAKRVAGRMWKWLLLGVCYDYPYYYLAEHGIPCGKDLYYKLRRRFYYEIAKQV